MSAPHVAPDSSPAMDLDVIRHQRSDLRTDLHLLEQALARPLPGRPTPWADAVHEALVELAAAFERHIAVTEGIDGLFDDILRTAPRLANHVRGLSDEHSNLRTELADLLVAARRASRAADAEQSEALRTSCLELLSELSRHRQKGADLVYEAYTVDIGGGD